MTKPEHVTLLSDHVRNLVFNDAKGSVKDSSLLGPPSVEFAPYGRVPNSRPCKDARQGTIDQDPEFIDFLESLTNPVTKPAQGDQDVGTVDKPKEKVTVTPLVQFLKDKKANKGKESLTTSKGGKHARQESKDANSSATHDVKSNAGVATVSSPKKRSAQAVKVEQAARDAVKVLNKQAANANKAASSNIQPASSPTVKLPAVGPNSAANAALADKKRERGNASAAAKILQRDLGLAGNVGGRGGRRDQMGNAANTGIRQGAGRHQASNLSSSQVPVTATSPATTPVAVAPVQGPAATAKPQISPQPPIGPAASRSNQKTPAPALSNVTSPNAISSPSKTTIPPPTTTQAFLKHANPSQGITEPLLEEAFVSFGKINNVEIDKKKGFAYVDFVEPESLQRAIKASPIKVAQGQVVVLERKTGPSLQARNARGGGPMMGNRGGGMPMRGSPRGRGGFGRGGMGIPNVANNTRLTSAAAKPTPAATQVPITAAPAASQIEGGAAPSAPASAPTPAASAATTTAPAD